MKRLLNIASAFAVGIAAAAFVVISDAHAGDYTYTLGSNTDSSAQQTLTP